MQFQLWGPNGFQNLNSMFPTLLPQALSTQHTGPEGCWIRCAFMSYNMVMNSFVLTQRAASEFFMLFSAKPYKPSLVHNTCFFSPVGKNTYLASHAGILHYKLCHCRFRSELSVCEEKSTSRAKCTLLLQQPLELCCLNLTLKFHTYFSLLTTYNSRQAALI